MSDSKTSVAKKATKKTVSKKVEKARYAVSLVEMLEAGVHFGHQARRWNPKMAPYIWQTRDGIHIFDLIQVSKLLNDVCTALKNRVAEGKTVVLIGTKRQAKNVIKKYAEQNDIPYINSRWVGGTLTNWGQVNKSLKKLNDIRDGLKNNKFAHYTKKERVLLERKAVRLERLFGGIAKLKKAPDILFVVDPTREITAVKEAKAKGVEVFALADSNADPDNLDYLIPGNDDANRSIEVIIKQVAAAIAEGKELAKTKKVAK